MTYKNFKNNYISLLLHPRAWLVVTILIPCLFIIYSLIVMRLGADLAGIMDHAVFIAVYVLLSYLAAALFRARWLRIPATLAVLIIFILFFLANILYFRFFDTWLYFDLSHQASLLSPLKAEVKRLIKPSDLVFLVFIPLLLWGLGSVSGPSLRKRTVAIIFFCACLLAAARGAMISKNFLFVENTPFFFFIRQEVKQVSMTFITESSYKRIARNVDLYRNLNSTLYASSGNNAYPFEKVPLTTSAPLKKRPNIVLVLMESQRAYESGSYGHKPSFSPCFDKLAMEGLLFSNFYSNTSQTTKAEFTILNSFYPNFLGGSVYASSPGLSVISLPMILKKYGYSTLWISSYDSEYGNKRGFLSRHGVDEFHSKINSPKLNLGWGPSDDDIFAYALNILSRHKEPFFAEIMTLSNHFPFNYSFPTIPQTPRVDGDDMYRDYTRGMYYADHALGAFFDMVRKSPLADNTIFIITGDHGIWVFPTKPELDHAQRQEIYFRTPFLIWSPKLIKPGLSQAVGSEVDIAPTMLDIAGIQERNSFLGASLLKPDTAPRFVLMMHDERWNFRRENLYVYDSQTEIFKEHFPDNLKAENFLPSHVAAHEAFVLKGDLMRSLPAERERQSRSARNSVETLVEDAIDAFQKVLYGNRISPGR